MEKRSKNRLPAPGTCLRQRTAQWWQKPLAVYWLRNPWKCCDRRILGIPRISLSQAAPWEMCSGFWWKCFLFLLRFSLVKDRVCRRLQRYYTLLALWKCRSACKVDHRLQSWPTANPFTTTADWFELSMGMSDNGVYPLMANKKKKKYNKPGDLGEKLNFGTNPTVLALREKKKQNLCRLHEIKSSVPDSNIIQTPGMFQFALSF